MNWFVFWIVILPVLISPISMQIIRQLFEGGQPATGFNPKSDSWAYLFGDFLILPFSMGMAARDAQHVSWLLDWRFIVAVIVGGCIFSVGFRWFDSNNYIRDGHRDRLYSPTKLWHDFVVYPVVASVFLWVTISALSTGALGGWVAVGGIALFFTLGGVDMIRGLKPEQMHPRVQDTAFARFPWLVRLAEAS